MNRKEFYHQLLNSLRWRKLRLGKLAQSPFCADCRLQEIATEATEVHHVIPIETGATFAEMRRLAYAPLNLVSLCPDCHRQRHRDLRSHDPKENQRRATERAQKFWEIVDGAGPRSVAQAEAGG